MDKNFFHNHLLYKHRKGIALLLLIGFLGSPLGGALPARAEDKAATGDTQSKGALQGLILDPMKTFFSGLASFNYGDLLKLIIKDSLNAVVDRFYSQVVKSFEDEYLVQDYNRQVFVPYLDFGFAKFHNWVASEVGDAKIDAPLLNAFLGLENLAYRGLKETGNKLSHSILKELDKVSKEMSGEDRPPSISDRDYWSKNMARIWSTPQGLLWGAVGTTMDVAASSEAEGNRDYIISEGHNDGRKVTDMPEAIESYFLKRGDNLKKSELISKLQGPQGWGYTQILSPASGAVSGYNLASKGTYYVYPLSNGFYRYDIWSWDADFPFALFCDIQYKIETIKTLVKPNVWQEPQEVYPASIAFTSRAISNPLASGWTGLIKRPGQKVKVMVNDLIESKLKIAGDASDLSGVSRIMYDLGKTYLTNVNFKVKRATSGALAGCPVGFEVIEPDLGTTMGKMGEPTRPSAGQCLIAALKQIDTNFLGEVVGWVSDLGKKLICWIFDVGNKEGERLTVDGNGIDTQNYIMVPNQGPLPPDLQAKFDELKISATTDSDIAESLRVFYKTQEEAAKTDPNGYTPLLVKNPQGEFQAQASSTNKKESLLSVSTLAQYIVYKELVEPLLSKSVAEAGKTGISLLGRAAKWVLVRAGSAVGLEDTAGDIADSIGSWVSDSGVTDILGELANFYVFKTAIRKILELLRFCNLKPEANQIKTETVNLSAEGRYDFLEFPYRLTEKSNVTVGIYLRPTGAAIENIKLYRKLVFNDMPAGVHIARWDLSTDLSYPERNQIWSEITKSAHINVVFQKEVDGVLEVFQEYILPEMTEKQFWGGDYKPDPTTTAKNCHTETYFTPPGGSNPAPCGRGYLIQNYMLELPQDPPANQNMNVFDRQFAPTPIFYEGQEVPITMRYNNNNHEKPADNVRVTLYDLVGVEGSADSFFGSANFYTGDLISGAGSQIAKGGAKKVYEGLIQMSVICPEYHFVNHPSCDISTGPITWTADGDGAHALVMVFDSPEDQNKLNNRIVQIVNVSASPVTAEYEIIDGPKTADLRGDGDHPDGDGTGVANPGEDIEIGVTLKDIRPAGSGKIEDLEVYIDLGNSSVFQYGGTGGKNELNKSLIKIDNIVAGQTLILNKDFNIRVKDDTKFSGDEKVPLYIKDQYGRVIFHQDLTVKVAPRCSDGKDNDKDGFIDFPADWGCDYSGDNSEDDDTNILKKPDLVPVGLDFNLVSSPTSGVVKDSKLDLKFKITNQGNRAIAKGTDIPMGVYVCYGQNTTKAYHKTWRYSGSQGYYCGTPAYDVYLPIDECYCEPKPPAHESTGDFISFSNWDNYFQKLDFQNERPPSDAEEKDYYKNYINCVKEKYQRVTDDSYTYSPTQEFGINETQDFVLPSFIVKEEKDMHFAVFVDEKVDANLNETAGVIPELNEGNNKAGFPDLFCEAGQDTAYLTVSYDHQCNDFSQYATYAPPKYLSMCMNSFTSASFTDPKNFRIKVNEKGNWYPDTSTSSPFTYQYVCPSSDICKKAGCATATEDDWRANPGEYLLLTVNLTNTAAKDVKSTFTLIDGPGTKTGINLTTPKLDSEAGQTKQLFFYITIPMNDTDGHPYNNNDTLTFTLKGKEADNSPNKPNADFVIAANLPVKFGVLPVQCPDKPKEEEPIPVVDLEMKDVGLAKSPNNPKKLTPSFQIKNGSSIGVPPLTNITYHYMGRYFKEEPTGIRDRGCYSNGYSLVNDFKGDGSISTLSSGSWKYISGDTYTVGNTDEDYGFYQIFAQVDGKPVEGEDISDPKNNFGCSDYQEVKKPDVEVTAVTLAKTMFSANQDTFTGTFTVKNNGSEEIPGNNIDYVFKLFEGNNPEPVYESADHVGQKMGAGAVATIKLKNGGIIGYGYPGRSYLLVVEITVPDKYDEDKGNNIGSASVSTSPPNVVGWSKARGNLQSNTLTLTQRIKRVLNYVRLKLGD